MVRRENYDMNDSLSLSLGMTTKPAYLVSRTKSMTGAFLCDCACAHDKFTERDVNPVIIGRLGASGTSCTTNSVGSAPLLSFIVQKYSPLSINFTGLNCKLKFFAFSDRWKKKIDPYGCEVSQYWAYAYCPFSLTLWSCSFGCWPFINFIIIWLDFQVNFSILKTVFSPMPGQASVKLVPAMATTRFTGRFSVSGMIKKRMKMH